MTRTANPIQQKQRQLTTLRNRFRRLHAQMVACATEGIKARRELEAMFAQQRAPVQQNRVARVDCTEYFQRGGGGSLHPFLHVYRTQVEGRPYK